MKAIIFDHLCIRKLTPSIVDHLGTQGLRPSIMGVIKTYLLKKKPVVSIISYNQEESATSSIR